MPAKDLYHDTVVTALEKDGWRVRQQQVYLRHRKRRLYIDLRAEHSARGDVAIIEVKSFLKTTAVLDDLAFAVGKYMLYRQFLRALNEHSALYLAVPVSAYNGVLSEPLSLALLREANVALLVFEPVTEDVVKWINTL
jgi:hypothetical protein